MLLTENCLLITVVIAPVAQLDRASASEAEGRRFKSSQARQNISCQFTVETCLLLVSDNRQLLTVNCRYGPLAQLVEQLTLNQRVGGSNPPRPPIFLFLLLSVQQADEGNGMQHTGDVDEGLKGYPLKAL